MKALLQAILRSIANLAASEAGELLSVRRKAHLLQHEMYARLAEDAEAAPRRKVATPATALRHTAIRSRRLTPSAAR